MTAALNAIGTGLELSPAQLEGARASAREPVGTRTQRCLAVRGLPSLAPARPAYNPPAQRAPARSPPTPEAPR